MIHGLLVRDTEPENLEKPCVMVRNLHSPWPLVCFSELDGTVGCPAWRIEGEFLPGDQNIPVKPAVENKSLSGDRVKGGKTKDFPLADGKDGSGVAGTTLL